MNFQFNYTYHDFILIHHSEFKICEYTLRMVRLRIDEKMVYLLGCIKRPNVVRIHCTQSKNFPLPIGSICIFLLRSEFI